MRKRILISIIMAIFIVGIIMVGFVNKLISFKIREHEVVSMKYYISEERYENYYAIPNDLEKQSIEEIISVFNEGNIKNNTDYNPINDSNRKLYIFLENKDVIIINNNSMDENKYTIEFPDNSLLRVKEVKKYAVINSERLKDVFLNIEDSFKNVNVFEDRMKV